MNPTHQRAPKLSRPSIRRWTWQLGLGTLGLLLSSGNPLYSQPPESPPQPTDSCAVEPSSQNNDVSLWLDRLHQRAQEIQSFQARLRYDRIQGFLGEKQSRFGLLYYQAGPPARYAVHLERRLADGRLELLDHWFIFDGTWLVEKIAHQEPRRFLKRQVVDPNRPAESSDPLAMGEGPFLLPVKMNKDRILARFDVQITLEPADTASPTPSRSAEAVASPEPLRLHLHLKPKPGQQTSISELDLWYDAKSLLPLRARVWEKDSENESLVQLSDPVVNASIDPAIWNTSEPTEPGWEVFITPWENR